jgi:hypothetical protein
MTTLADLLVAQPTTQVLQCDSCGRFCRAPRPLPLDEWVLCLRCQPRWKGRT